MISFTLTVTIESTSIDKRHTIVITYIGIHYFKPQYQSEKAYFIFIIKHNKYIHFVFYRNTHLLVLTIKLLYKFIIHHYHIKNGF